MPRSVSAVKPKRRAKSWKHRSLGPIDLHFHGAFGVDLMRASSSEMNDLARSLGQHGIAGFCPTTLSTSPEELAAAVARLGDWIRSPKSSGAVPLGLHLEGPFIHTACCGAHPPSQIRKIDFAELNRLWKLSRETIKILTLAPEILTPVELTRLVQWARQRKIALSLGHSQASAEQARQAFAAGFRGVTHAWNAMPFHHRAAGPLGAALGDPAVYVELIIDQIHVSAEVLDWTERLHPAESLCYISDCAPAAGLPPGKSCSFGPLTIHSADGACRVVSQQPGALAGGGKLLIRSFCDWAEARPRGVSLSSWLRQRLPSLTTAPLHALGISPARARSLGLRSVEWSADSAGKLTCIGT